MTAAFLTFVIWFSGAFGFSTGLVLPFLAAWTIMRSAMK